MGIVDLLKKKKEAQITANQTAGKNFLAENAKKEGIHTSESGLQYEILEEGTGAQPSATSTVTCHYEGKLLSGDIFDSSIKRGQPASFPLNRVIPGWTEGLQYMKEGGKYRFFIPDHLAYGEQAAGRIPPGSTLIFEVHLLQTT